jgi:hypothetical protein
MGPKSKARPIIEALYGRPLDTSAREVPDGRYMLNRSMLAMVVYETKDDGSDRAVLTMCKPYTENGAAAASPTGRSAPPKPAPKGGQGGLYDQVKAAIRKAEILGTPRHLDWLAMEDDSLKEMSDSDLYAILEEVNADIQAA